MENLEVLDLVNKGGLLVGPILLCSLIGTAIFFERLLRYRKFLKHREDYDSFYQLIHDGKFATAQEFLSKRNPKLSAAKRLMLEALNVDDPDRETVEMVLVHGVEREIASLSSYLSTLGVLGSTAPLLGLLGTVLGMIKAFSVVESMGGSVNASVLAGGIWEAMLTTALGLSVAIPLLFFHNHLESRLKFIREYLEEVAIEFMKAWSKGHHTAH
ncbi:MAG: MotA/TolQ/ExbB proton channel family protein [Gammaproteobacteria bacterium]|jgi:biopolymer transport protein ExbB